MPPTGADQAIRQLDQYFVQAANARDAKSLVNRFYAENAVLMPPNAPMAEGREAIRTFLQGLMNAGFRDITLETTTIESAGDLAYGRGRYQLRLTPPGSTPLEDVGKYVVVYRRQTDGSWRAIADIFNSDRAAA